jgi:hypothetical protein
VAPIGVVELMLARDNGIPVPVSNVYGRKRACNQERSIIGSNKLM